MSASAPGNNLLYTNPTRITVESESGETSFFFPDVDNTRIHVEHVLQGIEHPILQLEGYEVRTVVDIGANIGTFVHFIKVHFPSAQCFCFEPSSGAFKYLIENTKAFTNVELLQLGLYEEDGEMTLYDGATQGLQSSLFKSQETGQDGSQISLRNAEAVLEELGVDSIAILKIDTEGSEVPILRSLEGMFETVDQLYVEYHSESDRREIEMLLSKTHVLARASAGIVHRGNNHYVNASLLEKYPALNEWKIDRSQDTGLNPSPTWAHWGKHCRPPRQTGTALRIGCLRDWR